MAGEHVHGPARIVAALTAAPAAGALANLALAAILPAPEPVRLTLGFFGLFPAMAAGACLALLARSGARAWLASIAVAAVSLAVVVLS